MRTFRWLLVAAGTAMLLAPATSQAATWRGKTEQGRKAVVQTGANGKVSYVLVRWRTRCGDGETLRTGTWFRAPMDLTGRRRFRDGGSHSYTIGGGPERARERVLVRGKRVGGRWVGDFRARIRVTRNGRFVAWCKTGKVGWSARRVR